MGVVDIPGAPIPPGRARATLQLDSGEAQQMIDKLKLVLENFRQHQPSAMQTSGPAGIVSAAVHAAGAPLNPAAQPYAQPAAMPPPPGVAAATGAAYSRAPPPAAYVAPPAAAAVPRRPPPPPAARSHPAGALEAAPDVEPEVLQQIARLSAQEATAPPMRRGWNCVWNTEPADHNREPLQAMVYAPTLDGLVTTDSHTGWLVSASPRSLVLWETVHKTSWMSDVPNLMMMHAQDMDVKVADLAVETATSSLMAAGSDNAGREYVSLHSLQPMRLFSKTAQLRLTPQHQTVVRSMLARQVVSLHSYGGALRGCCAASYNGHIMVYATLNQNSDAKPMADWEAHDTLISVLHRSDHALHLWSGATQGSIKMWDMKSRPGKPSVLAQQPGRGADVTGLCSTHQHSLISSSRAGTLHVWDVRRMNTPIKTVKADGREIRRMAVSPLRDSLAVITPGGVYTMYLLDLDAGVVKVNHHEGDGDDMAAAGRSPATRLAWGSEMELFVGRHDGSIGVYNRAL